MHSDHPARSDDEACRTLARALADADWQQSPVALDAGALERALPELEHHGLAAAAAARLRATPLWPSLPLALRDSLEARMRGVAARELAARAALDATLAALAQDGIDSLLIKGEALARTVFPAMGLRERCDVDLWVRHADFARAESALRRHGFTSLLGTTGEWVQPERSFVRSASGVPIDLHRRLFTQPLLARALPYEIVRASASPLGGTHIPCPAHSLLIAVLHRIGHHGESDRLLWLWDMHLLVQHDPGAAGEAAAIAREMKVAALFGDALALTAAVFGTRLPSGLAEELLAHAPHERSAALLQGMLPVRRWLFDFRSLPDWRARARYFAETFFPAPEYMRARFGAERSLPRMYVERALGGVAAALRRR